MVAPMLPIHNKILQARLMFIFTLSSISIICCFDQDFPFMNYLAASIFLTCTRKHKNRYKQKWKGMENKHIKQYPIALFVTYCSHQNKKSMQQGYKLWLTTCMLIQSMMHTLGNLVAPVPYPTSYGNNYYYQLVTMVAIALQSLVVQLEVRHTRCPANQKHSSTLTFEKTCYFHTSINIPKVHSSFQPYMCMFAVQLFFVTWLL